MTTKNEIMVKPYSVKELSKIYGVCTKTMKLWLRLIHNKIGVLHGRYYTVKQVEILFKSMGLPFQLEK